MLLIVYAMGVRNKVILGVKYIPLATVQSYAPKSPIPHCRTIFLSKIE